MRLGWVDALLRPRILWPTLAAFKCTQCTTMQTSHNGGYQPSLPSLSVGSSRVLYCSRLTHQTDYWLLYNMWCVLICVFSILVCQIHADCLLTALWKLHGTPLSIWWEDHAILTAWFCEIWIDLGWFGPLGCWQVGHRSGLDAALPRPACADACHWHVSKLEPSQSMQKILESIRKHPQIFSNWSRLPLQAVLKLVSSNVFYPTHFFIGSSPCGAGACR